MSEQLNTPSRGRGNATLGIILLVLGAIFLVFQIFDFGGGFWSFFWPFFVILPGLVLLVVTRSGGEFALPAAIIGGIVTMTGLLLLYQNITNHWESWAYAWALVAPGGVGVGMLVDGRLNNRPQNTRQGWELIRVSLGIFVIGAVFFELVLGISGFFRGWGKYALPGLLIVLGIYLLVRNLTGSRQPISTTGERPPEPPVPPAPPTPPSPPRK